MAIFELFSKRQKKLRGEVPDVYTYDEVPNPLRVQIIHIWKDTIGKDEGYREIRKNYQLIIDTLCREYGLFELPTAGYDKDALQELAGFLLQEKNIEKVIDVIELSFKVISIITSENGYLNRYEDADKIAMRGIKELNNRFKEHGVGYQFIGNEIIRIDSELIHVEAVKPALRLLNEKNYKGAQEEFLSAYEHYRHGKNKEALNDCLKSFESTMKAIISKHGWESRDLDKATASKLIKICFDNNLVPSFWQTQISSLKSILESSIPTGRNRLSGHGQGVEVKEIPAYLVSYMLHMTASTLVFLTTAEKDLETR